MASPADFPPDFTAEFVGYCRAHGISPAEFHRARRIPRYFAVSPRLREDSHHSTTSVSSAAAAAGDGVDRSDDGSLCDRINVSLMKEGIVESLRADAADDTDEDKRMAVRQQSSLTVTGVPWLPVGAFVQAPGREQAKLRVAAWSLHRSGLVTGMDAASAVAVLVLGPRPGEAVLDVCAAPGMKLSLLAEAVASHRNARSSMVVKSGSDGGEQSPAAMTTTAAGGGGVAVGLDVSLKRLFAARGVLTRRQVPNALLVLGDGRRFDPGQVDLRQHRSMTSRHWDRALQRRHGDTAARKRQAPSTSAPDDHAAVAPSSSSIDAVLAPPPSNGQSGAAADVVYESPSLSGILDCVPQQFDRVLVDAECTHDGSMAHVLVDHSVKQCRRDGDGTSAQDRARPPAPPESCAAAMKLRGDADHDNHQLAHAVVADTEALHDLQCALLSRAVDLLKPGGTVVYSTCSFSVNQNEKLVARFLRSHMDSAELVDPLGVDDDDEKEDDSPPGRWVMTARLATQLEAITTRTEVRAVDGTERILGHALRMTPLRTSTSFQFIAKLRKRR